MSLPLNRSLLSIGDNRLFLRLLSFDQKPRNNSREINGSPGGKTVRERSRRTMMHWILIAREFLPRPRRRDILQIELLLQGDNFPVDLPLRRLVGGPRGPVFAACPVIVAGSRVFATEATGYPDKLDGHSRMLLFPSIAVQSSFSVLNGRVSIIIARNKTARKYTEFETGDREDGKRENADRINAG